MKQIEQSYEVVVCGGGLAGFSAALAAARCGAKTVLIQDRPVLGGNASSEIRVGVHGAAGHHNYARETGIISEALNAQSRLNHVKHLENGSTNSVQDMVLYDMAIREPNLTLHLNTSLCDVLLDSGEWGLDALSHWPVSNEDKGYRHRPSCHGGARIEAIRAVVANAETELLIRSSQFIDCTGDALLGHLSGCEWRWGSESTTDTGEIHAPGEASTDTMGNSIHIRCINIGRPAPFRAPEWAVHYDDAAFFYEQGRVPGCEEGGFWWIEIGVPYDTIFDNETIRHELTRHALGVWDWMKNRDPEMKERCRNFALDFIGQVPGKRESRRIIGRHFLNENELQDRKVFPDEVAYGGWFVDLHTPGGLLAPTSEPASALGYNPKSREVALKNNGPYGIPLRALQSKDVHNLMMAGRNISVTHAALGTVRVMATCALMGQATGTTAAFAVRRKTGVTQIPYPDIQQRLLRDGCFLPNYSNTDPLDLARQATASASSRYQFTGISPWEKARDPNFHDYMMDPLVGREVPVSDSLCQWFYLDGRALARIGLSLHNLSPAEASVSVALKPVDSLWDYQVDSAEPAWAGEVIVPAGADETIWCEVRLHGHLPGCYRLEVSGPDTVLWRVSQDTAYGLSSGMLSGSGRYKWGKAGSGTFAFQLDPGQDIYNPGQVLSGINRPQRHTNLWLSDPGASLPQHVELAWPEPVDIRCVELTFPMQLVLEVRFENPFYVAPHIARRYQLQARTGDPWRTLHRELDNAGTRRRHVFPETVRTDGLRLLVEATHGGHFAGLTEIRCYA